MGRSKQSVMVSGLCYRQTCHITAARCGKGYCPACCRAFHNCNTAGRPGGVQIVASNISQGPTASAAPVSTAIQPQTFTYEPGEVRLVCTQDIKS